MTRKNSAQKATNHSASASQTRPNRQTSPLSKKSRQRKPLTVEQRERKNAHDRARRAALRTSSPASPSASVPACSDCSSCRRLAQCRASDRTDGFPQAQVSRPPALPPAECRPEPVSAPVPRRLGPPQAVVVPLSGAPCRLGVVQPVYAASRFPHAPLVAALRLLLDLVDPSAAASSPRASCAALPVRPFRRDVCGIVERRNVEFPEEGWE